MGELLQHDTIAHGLWALEFLDAYMTPWTLEHLRKNSLLQRGLGEVLKNLDPGSMSEETARRIMGHRRVYGMSQWMEHFATDPLAIFDWRGETKRLRWNADQIFGTCPFTDLLAKDSHFAFLGLSAIRRPGALHPEDGMNLDLFAWQRVVGEEMLQIETKGYGVLLDADPPDPGTPGSVRADDAYLIWHSPWLLVFMEGLGTGLPRNRIPLTYRPMTTIEIVTALILWRKLNGDHLRPAIGTEYLARDLTRDRQCIKVRVDDVKGRLVVAPARTSAGKIAVARRIWQ